ncbi:MAG: hypothetical protein EXX96DRAFT_477804 [Benjaminiella poitrasii]|nr:MAG: hypothetical protein EXX96DRAFT_477804 [Benjaminiella poitrasii]
MTLVWGNHGAVVHQGVTIVTCGNFVEQFWVLVKGKMKRHRLMKKETLSSRIGDACNDVRFSDLYDFCLHSKRQNINCFKRTPF